MVIWVKKGLCRGMAWLPFEKVRKKEPDKHKERVKKDGRTNREATTTHIVLQVM